MDAGMVRELHIHPKSLVTDESFAAAERALADASDRCEYSKKETASNELDWKFDSEAEIDAFAQSLQVWEELDFALRQQPPINHGDHSKYKLPALGAIAASLVLMLSLAIIPQLRATTYSTEIGEQKNVRLQDGTNVILNTNSLMKVQYAKNKRNVHLKYGEAMFGVAHDAKRPFIVKANRQTVEALGTSFIVRNEGKNLEVTLLSGSVKVAQERHDAEPAILLEPGERLRDGETQDAPQEKVASADIDRPALEVITAWRRGEIFFDETSLTDAVDEVNRYSKKPILLNLDNADEPQLSGVVRIDELDAFVDTVADLYDLKISSTENSYILSQQK